MKTTGPCRKAFTLLEMLISATLGAFIALVALSGLRSVTAARSAIDKHSETVDELRIAAEQLRTDLSNVRPFGNAIRFEGLIDQTGAVPTPRIIFRTFSRSKARLDQPESELYEVEYFITEDQQARTLMRRVCPIVGLDSQTATEVTDGGILEVVAGSIVAFDVRYFDSGNWTDQWSSENMRPPQLVLVNLAVGQAGTVKQKIYSRQVAVGFKQGEFTDEVDAANFEWDQAESGSLDTGTMDTGSTGTGL